MNSPHILPQPRPVWPLALCTVLLVCGGLVLVLSSPQSTVPAALSARTPAAASTHHERPTPSAATAPAAAPAASLVPSTAPSTRRTTPGAAPPRDDGPGGDPAIQQLLERSWPRDLPQADEEQLVAAGRRLLAADATGRGRDAFPALFPPGERKAVVPAFTRIRIQAAIARTDPAHPGQAVVHLVWAGADRGGTYTEGRLCDLTFTRTPSKNGATTWMPLPLA